MGTRPAAAIAAVNAPSSAAGTQTRAPLGKSIWTRAVSGRAVASPLPCNAVPATDVTPSIRTGRNAPGSDAAGLARDAAGFARDAARLARDDAGLASDDAGLACDTAGRLPAADAPIRLFRPLANGGASLRLHA